MKNSDKGITRISLPLSFYARVIAGNRITIPSWIKFVEPGDVIKGVIKVSPDDLDFFPFEKKVSVSRHITVGFIKSNLKDQVLPSKLYVTIQEIKKLSEPTEREFNLFCFIIGYESYDLRYKLFSIKDELQFFAEKVAEDIKNKFLGLSKDPIELLGEDFNGEYKRWFVPIKIESHDEFGNRIICLLLLILNNEGYQEFNHNRDKIWRLLKRYQSWLTTIDDCTHESLSILSLELKEIISSGEEPRYYGITELLKFNEVERLITQLLLVSHRAHKGGLNIEQIFSELSFSKKTVREAINRLIDKSVIWEPEKDIFDISWHI